VGWRERVFMIRDRPAGAAACFTLLSGRGECILQGRVRAELHLNQLTGPGDKIVGSQPPSFTECFDLLDLKEAGALLNRAG
jgi:hypothetical protein